MSDSVPPLTDDHQPPPGARQEQFLNVISRDEAQRRFHDALTFAPPDCETIPLSSAAGRVLWGDVVAAVDVPSFDRSNVDGFAVCSADTRKAAETAPRLVHLSSEVLSPGVRPTQDLAPGTAMTIATGGMLPRGADAVLMVEHSELADDGRLEIHRAVGAGENVTFAGTDISRGETVLRAGQLLTSRELGVIAAIGQSEVGVVRQPRVAILSTGDEIVPPGNPLPVGSVYDSNAAILAAAVAECGGVPVPLGVVPDDEPNLEAALREALQHDVVLLSGGTSKGAGDLSYRIVSRLGKPGIVAHGVALKPGKPICLAVCDKTPVVILPGFPTSAIFTFHEFAAPVIRRLAGRTPQARRILTAALPHRVNSQRGRTEYLLVNLFERDPGYEMRAASDSAARDPRHASRIPQLVAYPLGQGSGSVTTFSRADGFITIDQQTEIVEPGTPVEVTLLDEQLRPADLTVITSHCIGLDRVLSHVQRQEFTIKVMAVGSTAALAAAKRGECDVAGIHLLDPHTGEYNRPFVTDEVELVRGYGRMQCLVCRPDDDRFADLMAEETIRVAVAAVDCRMVNRNAGSGTRILLDRLLSEAGVEPSQVAGYGVQVRSHNAVCAAVQHRRADWGVAIDVVASLYGLRTIPISAEQFDFVIPRDRIQRPAVRTFVETLNSRAVREELQDLGFAQPDVDEIRGDQPNAAE
jgi:putative molybdopterin biosynthesis protein